jgi:hypothetical protein
MRKINTTPPKGQSTESKEKEKNRMNISYYVDSILQFSLTAISVVPFFVTNIQKTSHKLYISLTILLLTFIWSVFNNDLFAMSRYEIIQWAFVLYVFVMIVVIVVSKVVTDYRSEKGIAEQIKSNPLKRLEIAVANYQAASKAYYKNDSLKNKEELIKRLKRCLSVLNDINARFLEMYEVNHTDEEVDLLNNFFNDLYEKVQKRNQKRSDVKKR